MTFNITTGDSFSEGEIRIKVWLMHKSSTLADRYGRIARDMRVSLTDRCNLRCSYCMPAEGLEWMPNESLLSDEEVKRLCTIAVEQLGVRAIRFTGGEPLLRKSLEEIIAHCATLRTDEGEVPDLALTTNALGLDRRARDLRESGLKRVNISLDTVNPEHFRAITRRARLEDVIAGIRAAHAAGLTPVKVNAVLIRGLNESDLLELLEFCIFEQCELRIIEQMPIGPIEAWKRDRLVTQADILSQIQARYTIAQVPSEDPTAPARLWHITERDYTFGIIASVSSPFCATCDRTRLTADGQIRSCLFSQQETDLRTPLRSGASDEELAQLWRDTMWLKPAAHGRESSTFVVPSRTMSAIGG